MIRLETLRAPKVEVQVLTGGEGPDLLFLHGAVKSSMVRIS